MKHSHFSADKKEREFELIEEFLLICPDFRGYTFARFAENPDMMYVKDGKEIGFDSVIISEDQANVDCYFDANMCTIGIPSKLTKQERADKIAIFFENKLFKHWRRYSVPTVLVFSLLDTETTTFDELVEIARRFQLPEFSMYNIFDYYICDGKRFVKIAESH